MGKKTQRAWSPEARQRHLDGCRRYQVELKKMEAEWEWARNFRKNYPGGPEKVDEVIELIHELERQGISAKECLNFAILVKKNNRELSDEQGLRVNELLRAKFAADQIYQQIFEVTA